MNVMLISQCEGRALKETRRILDQFAERKGDRTWQTAITQQGLLTLRRLLRKTARRNTAVICHWIKKANYTELLWVVGNPQKFNEQGSVPTNSTKRNILRSEDENTWHTTEAIALLAGLAGLFHDVGKANALFQKKLQASTFSKEPCRHEWVSLRIFQAFVGNSQDKEWLQRLAEITPESESAILENLKDIQDFGSVKLDGGPFSSLKGVAKLVGWLIVSHHRLPRYSLGEKPTVGRIDSWLDRFFNDSWNSLRTDKDSWSQQDWRKVWEFPVGTPFASKTWCAKARQLASRVLKHQSLFDVKKDWFNDRFSSHLARLSLMLADHCYSSSGVTEKYQDKSYQAYANTDKEGKLKQKLDEHNIAVSKIAFSFSRSLPRIRLGLPTITRLKALKKLTTNKNFAWQNKAYELASSIKEKAKNQGFFGVNMASTGCGKTFANARIMYGLAEEKLGCRFSVALGLRTLTLQTGDAFRDRLNLEDDDLAVMIGSQSIKQLHELHKDNGFEKRFTGSESEEIFNDDSSYVVYEGELDDGILSQWLSQKNREHKMISAPVLVSTIDHLMPATESERGGRQIAPMLRLLTSDLVLDEPDDFGLEDLSALSRLVNWAGMLGANVLLSSATMPPDLIQALFEAYSEGRGHYQKACVDAAVPLGVCCAWFDEKLKPQFGEYVSSEEFLTSHKQFVSKRVVKLQKDKALRYAKIIDVSPKSQETKEVINALANVCCESLYQLHDAHHEIHPVGKQKVSVGLVRMANINPMVAVAKTLLIYPVRENYRIHFCVYHSRHPLIIRSEMERVLDEVLKRDTTSPEKFWSAPSVKNVLKNYSESNHIFVVFATAVAEVGRDHDYDWAIAEPSSIRSLIQLAGRIQRHRKNSPSAPNFLILNKNYKALKGEKSAYCKPGFESESFRLKDKNLTAALNKNQYEYIRAVPRIQREAVLDPKNNLVDLEHAHLSAILFGGDENNPDKYYAKLWWSHNPSWSAQIQSKTRFRQSQADEEFVLWFEEEGDEPTWRQVNDDGTLREVDVCRFEKAELVIADGMVPWVANDYVELLLAIAENLDITLAYASLRFGQIILWETDKHWIYGPVLGVYKDPM